MLARKLTAASARAVAPWWRVGGAPEPVAAYQPIGAASLADSYVNLANPGTFDAAPGGAPTFSAETGWGFNGTTQYLTTGIVPAVGYAVIVRISSVGASGTRAIIGVASVSGAGLVIFSQRLSGQAAWRSGGTFDKSPAAADGTLGIGGQRAYRNGVDEGEIPAWTAVETRGLFLGANNNVGSPNLFFLGNIQAIAIYDTSTDHAIWVPAVSAAMAAL